jgi:pimeloyl-ACP methyl ester carboxylesterase
MGPAAHRLHAARDGSRCHTGFRCGHITRLEVRGHRSRLHRAGAAECEQKLESAREHYFHAALLYATAEWPIWETTPALVQLDDLKNPCFRAYARLADHHVESVAIPLGDSYIPAWFHLPPGYQGGWVRTVIYCGGMDAPKELNVGLGLSFGSYWMSQIDDMAAKIDLRPSMSEMRVPWLVVAGDEDEFSPIEHSYDLVAACARPSAMLVYQQGRHALSLPTQSVASGPNWSTYSADWLLDQETSA